MASSFSTAMKKFKRAATAVVISSRLSQALNENANKWQVGLCFLNFQKRELGIFSVRVCFFVESF